MKLDRSRQVEKTDQEELSTKDSILSYGEISG